MILCPNCQHHELTGALYCSKCGRQIVDVTDDSTQTAKYSREDILLTDGVSTAAVPSPNIENLEGLSLFLLRTEHIIRLTGQKEYSIGRAVENQPVVPDVDLTPYGAYDSGVSRLHATIKVDDLVTLRDLGSINGTRLNGRKIQPHSTHTLVHGDMLTLGKMKIQILIRT